MSGHTTHVLSCWVCKCAWVCVREYGCSKMEHLPCNGCFRQWRSCCPRAMFLGAGGVRAKLCVDKGWIEGDLENHFSLGRMATHMLGFVYACKQLWKQRTLKPTSPENMECAQPGEPYSSEFTSVRDDETQKPNWCSQESGKCEEADIGPGWRGKGSRSLSGSLGVYRP